MKGIVHRQLQTGDVTFLDELLDLFDMLAFAGDCKMLLKVHSNQLRAGVQLRIPVIQLFIVQNGNHRTGFAGLFEQLDLLHDKLQRLLSRQHPSHRQRHIFPRLTPSV